MASLKLTNSNREFPDYDKLYLSSNPHAKILSRKEVEFTTDNAYFRIEISANNLCVFGDFGCAVYRLDKMTWDDVATLPLAGHSYFISKCIASPYGMNWTRINDNGIKEIHPYSHGQQLLIIAILRHLKEQGQWHDLRGRDIPQKPVNPILRTVRGFPYIDFQDSNGVLCNIQYSSRADKEFIWLGAKQIGLQEFKASEGWRTVVLNDTIAHHFVANNRMHLDRDRLAEILPILQNFVDTGDVGYPDHYYSDNNLVDEQILKDEIKKATNPPKE